MKKIFSLLALLMFFVAGAVQAQESNLFWELVDEDAPLTEITPGQYVVLKEGENTGGWSEGGYLSSASGYVVHTISEDCIYQFEEVGMDGSHKTYAIKNVANGKYLSEGDDLYVSNVEDAFICTARIARSVAMDDLEAETDMGDVVELERAGAAHGVCFVFYNSAGGYYMAFGGNPNFWSYTDTSNWYVYEAKSREKTGRDKLGEVFTLKFPDGINGLFTPGESVGTVDQALYDAFVEAYNKAIAVYDSATSTDEECAAAAKAVMETYDAVSATFKPIAEGYFLFINQRSQDSLYMNAAGYANSTNGTEIKLTDLTVENCNCIWKLEAAEPDKYAEEGALPRFYFRNFVTGRYVGKLEYQTGLGNPSTEGPEVTFAFEAVPGGFFLMEDNFGGLGHNAGNGELCRWNDKTAAGNWWKVVTVPADVIAALEGPVVQNRLNIELETLYYESTEAYFKSYVVIPSADATPDSDYANDGIFFYSGDGDVQSEADANAFTNAPCYNENGNGYVFQLFDNDLASYFHTAWDNSVTEPHYLQINLDEPIQDITFKYTKRNNNGGHPAYWIVYGADSPEGPWVNQGKYTLPYQYGCTYPGAEDESDNRTGILALNMDKAYQYLRLEGASHGIFWHMAELRIYKGVRDGYPFNAVSPTVRNEFVAAREAARTALTNGTATEEICNRLAKATEAFKNAVPVKIVDQPNNTVAYYLLDKENLTATLNYLYQYDDSFEVPSEIYNEEDGLTYKVTAIGEYAFSNRPLQNVTLPNSIESIGNCAFNKCSALTSLVIPNSVKSIGEYIAAGCDNLQSIVVGDGVTTIPYRAFYGCPKLTDVTLGQAVDTIGINAFHSSGLTSFEFPASVTTLEAGAFGKTKLTSVHVPATLVNIGEAVFSGCQYLTEITVAEENPNYAAYEGGLYSKDHSTLYCVPANIKPSYTIPAEVTDMVGYAFEDCKDLQWLNFRGATPPAKSSLAFMECDKLTTIYVPVGAKAAYEASSWNSFTIKEYPYAQNEKYYVLKSAQPGDWAVHVTGPNHPVRLEKGWTTPTTWNLKDHIKYVWKADVKEGNILKLKSIWGYGDEYLSSAADIYQPFYTEWANDKVTEYVMAHADGNFFYLHHQDMSWNPFMHADTTYNRVVRWDGYARDPHLWEFVEVPADVIESWSAQLALNSTLRSYVESNMADNYRVHNQVVADFKNHGFLEDGLSVLSTNKQEMHEGTLFALRDGNPETYFHSSYNSLNSEGVYHYLQVDFNSTSDKLLLRYTRRITGTYNDSPTKIRILGEKNSEWVDLGVYALEYNETYFGMENVGGSLALSLPEAYFKLRFQVEETVDGRIVNDNLFFSLSEFGVWSTKRDAEYEANLNDAQKVEMKEVYVVALEELQNEAATQATIDRIKALNKLTSGLVTLTDGQVYTQSTELEASRITYTRNFKNTNWQAWYVPFDVAYDDISDEFTVARINGIHEYDDNNDGEFDRWTVEVLKLRPGATVYANLPYVIRANAKVNKQFVVENTTLYPADEQSVDCSTTTVLYTFKGVYSPMAGTVLRENGWFAMGGGGLVTPTASSTLNPNRWYLAPTARGGYAEYYTPKRIEIEVGNEDGDVTGIEGTELLNDNGVAWPADVYDLNGRLVKAQAENLDDLPKGVYVVDGQKVVK